jgi:single-strand DNA-binding protein
MFNKIEILGKVAGEPRAISTKTGNAMVEFRVYNEDYTTEGGVKKKYSEFNTVICFGSEAEKVLKYVKSGCLLFIEGKLQTRKYPSKKTGEMVEVKEVKAGSVRLLDYLVAGTPRKAANGDGQPGIESQAPDVDEEQAITKTSRLLGSDQSLISLYDTIDKD